MSETGRSAKVSASEEGGAGERPAGTRRALGRRLDRAVARHRRRQRLPLEKSLRTAVDRDAPPSGRRARPRDAGRRLYVAQVRSLGCTAYARETAALLSGDDVAFHNLYERLDPGHPAEVLRDVVPGIGAWAGPAVRARSVARSLTVGRRRDARRAR
jgi:hypothetical protein